MIPGSGGSQRLARLIGLGRAKNLIMRGKRCSAQEAFDYGLVSELHPPDELDAAVDALIDELKALSRWPCRWPSGCSTTPTTVRSGWPRGRGARLTVCCAPRTTSRRVSTRSWRSESRSLKGAESCSSRAISPAKLRIRIPDQLS